jgi:hypothetical protein
MIWILTGMSLLFVAIGFIVTEKNAGSFLAGYNSLTKEEQARIDIRSYLTFFRKFHVFLGISLGAIGLIANSLSGKNASGIFMVVYPVLAYTWFAWKSNTIPKALHPKFNWTGPLILAGTLIFVTGIIAFGFKEEKLLIGPGRIEIKGIYGEMIKLTDIRNIEMVSRLPDIKMKTNGFSLGSVKKGFFSTNEGETIKLILNSDQRPCILITKKSGAKIYYSAKGESNQSMLNAIIKHMPNAVYK